MSFLLSELAAKVNGELVDAKPDQVVVSIKSLTKASIDDLSFYTPEKNNFSIEDIKHSAAGAILTTEKYKDYCANAVIIVGNPKQAYAQLAYLFEKHIVCTPGIHATAVVGNDCKIDDTAMIGANVVIGNDVIIGANTVVQANSVIGDHVILGSNNQIFPHVTIYNDVKIGNYNIIHAGTIIGADGFGFVPNAQGQWNRIPQLGAVQIANHVSIGAACTIDCGALSDTIIEDGVKIDDQVHIAHNVVVGAHTIIAGYSAIAGSVTIGKHCMLAGGIRISDNLTIADKVILTAGSGVVKDVKEAGVYSSSIPATSASKWRRILARLYQLDRLAKTVKALEKKING